MGLPMQMARVFFSGGEQFVQLPPEFCFKSNEVDIFRRGAEVVLVEKPEAIGGALEEVIEGPHEERLPENRGGPQQM